MYESYAVVGERGQITLPKIIREKANIKSKERLIVKIENNSVLIEKEENLNKKNKLMEKGYNDMRKIDLETTNDFKNSDSDIELGDY